MPRTTAYTANVEYISILDEHGNFDAALAKDTLTDEEVKQLYELMITYREYDEGAFRLQRTGRMGTFPQNKGQEAAALGAAKAIRKGHDYLVPYYRENAASFLHGLPLHYIYLFWMGDERGNAIPKQYCMNPLCIEIGAQTLHAAGIAWAFKLRKEDKVCLGFVGDGATSTGDFHEGMNFAGVYKLPLVMSVINNKWAISVHGSKQTASETFAQKGLAYGAKAVRCDGNDIFAVYKAHKEAADRARKGEGPTLVESLTYRLADHTTADDARRYRDPAEFEVWAKRDPMIRTRQYLERKKLWNDDLEKKAWDKAKAITKEVTEYALAQPKGPIEDIFDHVYETLNPELLKQKQTLRTDSIGQAPEQIGLKSPTNQHESART